MDIPFVSVRDFTPNLGHWVSVGAIESVSRSGNVFTLVLGGGARSLQVSFPSPTCYRVRFNPAPNADYTVEISPAVVTRSLAPVNLSVVQNTPRQLVVDTGSMRVQIDLQPFRIRVFRGDQLVSADEPDYNLVYIPDQRVISNFKTRPASAAYCGFGQKAGAQLLKTEFTMTQFNYDNFKYTKPTVPSGTQAGPLNPSIALYVSIPFMLELNPRPAGDFAGPAYACGIFLDNPAQSYFNMGSNDYSDMTGKYYFGALFGDLDYYFFLGDDAPSVLEQYTTLTGRSPMPPRYVFGYHQGCYGYFDRNRLQAVADAYRAARIPCDGLHIDVDFQNNYRTFTHSEMKFPNAAAMMADLHGQGFKCSTNVTPILTNRSLDENGQMTPYAQRDALLQTGGLIYDTYAGQGPSSVLFEGQVNYGINHGFNPYPSPGNPTVKTNDGQSFTPLTAPGNYPDLGRSDVRAAWGAQYAHLINDLGLDMVWQDMMCPALDADRFAYGTFPLNLMINADKAGYVPDGVGRNAYALFLLMGTWDGLTRLRPDKRNFIIARGGYSGVQRYAALWTGDSATTWDFLRINLPEVLNLGLSGVPISGCDIGGFAQDAGGCTPGPSFSNGEVKGAIPDYELLTRWMHLGSFLPWYRNHYDGYNKEFQEPYRYGEPVPTNCRKYIELRYRMLQVYYDAMYQWTQSGIPIARPLFLNDSGPDVYAHLDDQFFVGRDFMVAPILFAGQGDPPVATRALYLPAGSNWYAFKDGAAPLDAPVSGGTTINDYRAGLDLVPIYVREGAILPMRGLEQYVGELAQNPLEINLYPGRDADYLLYQDDGITTQAANAGVFRTTRISQRTAGNMRSVRLTRIVDAYTPPESLFTVRFLGVPGAAGVTVAGAAAPDAGSAAGLAAAVSDAFYFDATTQTIVVKVMDTQPDVTIGLG
jgi:alpha-glucosidase